MKNKAILILGLFALAFTFNACREEPPPPEFETKLYQNDNWSAGMDPIFQAGFVSGERAAVTLGPIDETFIINSVEFLFGGEIATETVKVFVYRDDGSTKPGETLYQGDHELVASVTELQKIDLRDKEITFHGGGLCRIGIQFTHDGLPCVARDDDGSFSKGKNWIYVNNNWTGSENEGIKDDFIIRANIDTQKK